MSIIFFGNAVLSVVLSLSFVFLVVVFSNAPESHSNLISPVSTITLC